MKEDFSVKKGIVMKILIEIVTEGDLKYEVEIPLSNQSIKDLHVRFIDEEKGKPGVELEEKTMHEKTSGVIKVITPGYYSG